MWLQLGGYYGATHAFDADALAWMPLNGAHPQAAAIVNIRPERCKVLLHLTQAQLDTALTNFREAKDIFDWLVERGFAKLPEKEEYRVDGAQLPSVTYIIQHIIAKPGLMDWSYANGLEAGLRAAQVGWTTEQVHEALEAKALLDAKQIKKTEETARPWIHLREALAEAGYGPMAKRDAAAVVGTHWHKSILFYLQGKSVDLTDAPEAQVQMMTQFTLWAQRVKLQPQRLETKVANLEPRRDGGWAGTLDAIATCNLEPVG